MNPSSKIALQEWMKDHGPVTVIRLLSNNGEARFVGGCVRDAVIGKKIKDIDVATTHLPEGVIHILESKGITVIPTGMKHGTVSAIIDHKPIEITTLRRDIACFGRHADVEFTSSWHEDASRRDFTMNAMFMDLEGNIYDFFSGLADLKKGVVKFVGEAEQRIREDYLRILRLFRFHSYYGKKEISEDHLQAVKKNAPGLEQISGERIQAEMMKMLVSPDPSYVFRAMKDIGVLDKILPEGITFAISMLQSLLEKEKEDNAPFGDPYIRLAAMIGFSTKEQVEELCHRWRLSNRDRTYLLTLTDHDAEIHENMDEQNQKKSIRNIGKETFIAKVVLKWAREKGQPEKFRRILELAKKWEAPEFPLTGEDIIGIGIKEGKKVGELLKKAEEYWEAGDYKLNRDELLKYVKLRR